MTNIAKRKNNKVKIINEYSKNVDLDDSLFDFFAKHYDKFLSEMIRNNIIDIAKIMDIDVHSIDFGRLNI